MSESDHAIVAGTARLVVGLYFLAMLTSVGRRARCESVTSLGLWTAACCALLVHVVAAFEWAHHWSWVAAAAHTTQETERVVGTSTGVELPVNFVFAIWWAADCIVRWQARSQQRQLARSYNVLVQIVWAFLFFNATVVFGPIYWRWLAVPAIVLLILRSRTAARRSRDLSPLAPFG